MKKLALLALPLLVPVVWLVVGNLGASAQHEKPKMGAPTKAICVMTPIGDSKVHGIVTFTQKGEMVLIEGKIAGLTPGKHGFHVHEFGDMNSKDGLSTGGHFNPEGLKHGGRDDKERHVGDLGNVTADKNGVASFTLLDHKVKLSGPHSVIGRGLIVHAKEDDEKTQPTGDAGGRVAGGVIGVANDAPPKKK